MTALSSLVFKLPGVAERRHQRSPPKHHPAGNPWYRRAPSGSGRDSDAVKISVGKAVYGRTRASRGAAEPPPLRQRSLSMKHVVLIAVPGGMEGPHPSRGARHQL